MIKIPQASGLPGVPDPPNWLTAPPAVDYNLDEKRWYGATKRTFGSGSSDEASFRAIHATVGPQKYIYLSFRAKFAQSLSIDKDSVFLGLQKHGGTDAIVIQMYVHNTSIVSSGNPPASIPSKTKIWTRQGNVWTLYAAATPNWIAQNARVWVQQSTDVSSDQNCRWAIQVRIPVTAAGNILDLGGPDLGTDFDMWYLIRGGWDSGAVVILAENRISGGPTSDYDLDHKGHPAPSDWDEFLLTTGPGADGGVAIYGNWYSDIAVKNSKTNSEGIEIANGLNSMGQPSGYTNTFIVRPRNYRNLDIDPATIKATIRMANWGSVAGDPEQVDWPSGTWEYVPGNSEEGTTPGPVPSNLPIPVLAPGANPPSTTPIKLENMRVDLPSGKSRHQCIFVTLSSTTNMLFLTDSAFRNMNFDHASLIEREAEISVVGLQKFSDQPRDVYLAIEKINMQRNTSPGTNEGRFLEASTQRLITQGGALAEKLKNAQAQLSNQGDYGSGSRLESLLSELHKNLAAMAYSDRERGLSALNQLIQSLSQWLSAVKPEAGAANRLAQLFNALADWLFATGLEAAAKLVTFISQLSQWLSALESDPASAKYAPAVARALHLWLSTLTDGAKPAGLVEALAGWLNSDRSPGQLLEILNAIREFLSSLSTSNMALRNTVATFSEAIVRWLKGTERLDTFVSALSDAGLTEDETDQLFPTFRVHTYHDTGERVTGSDGKKHPVLRVQSSFGLYAYHEDELEGWQTSLQGAQRIADNLYLLAVPNNGTAKVTVRIQAVEPGMERIPEDPIKPTKHDDEEPCGCLCQILKLFGFGKKK